MLCNKRILVVLLGNLYNILLWYYTLIVIIEIYFVSHIIIHFYNLNLFHNQFHIPYIACSLLFEDLSLCQRREQRKASVRTVFCPVHFEWRPGPAAVLGLSTG